MILEIILKLGLAFVLVLAGAYILFAGRRALWATLGILALWATANILAVLVAGVSNGRELLAIQDWTLVGIALAAGVLGMLLGRFLPGLAMSLIGFIAGADIDLYAIGSANLQLVVVRYCRLYDYRPGQSVRTDGAHRRCGSNPRWRSLRPLVYTEDPR